MSKSDFHAVWCDHRGTGETHDDNFPYCMRMIHGVKTIPLDDDQHEPSLWVTATATAHPSAMTSGELAPDGQRYDGVELTIEKRVGEQWVEQNIRLRSDAARTLAATLVRAADIQQGLTR